MRALIPTGNPDHLVTFAEVDEPEPAADEAVITVEAFSPNRGETFLLAAPRPGWRPGKDVAGRVIRAADSGRGPAVGTRVVGHAEHSGWAERAAVPVDGLAVLPDAVPSVRAAALPLAGLTALRLLRVAGSVAGRRLLLTGASGGVGHYLTELAAHQGGLVTVVTSNAERAARLLALGAVQSVRHVAEAAGPFDVVLESTGGADLTAALRQLVEGGRLIWFGQASGQPPVLDFFDWSVPLNITLVRFGYQPSTHTDGADLATLVRLVVADRLHPELGQVGDWMTAAAALRDLVQRRVRGNVVLKVSAG